jgi:hypothetical protein
VRDRTGARVPGPAASARVEVFPSVTNFVLFRLVDREPAEVQARLLGHSVVVRDVSTSPGCAGCLRVSIGTHDENDPNHRGDHGRVRQNAAEGLRRPATVRSSCSTRPASCTARTTPFRS